LQVNFMKPHNMQGMLIQNKQLKKTFYISYPHKEHSDHRKETQLQYMR